MAPASPSPLPGGPLHPEFRNRIRDLANQAREDDQRAAEEARKRQRRRSFSRFVAVGLTLITLELASLAFLYHRTGEGVEIKKATVHSRFAPGSCNGIVFNTYWKVVRYLKANDHPPASLNDLVPKYLDKLPFDPVTGKPLEYSTHGNHFNLNCPGATTARR
jgi:hypothetical protein